MMVLSLVWLVWGPAIIRPLSHSRFPRSRCPTRALLKGWVSHDHPLTKQFRAESAPYHDPTA